MTKPMDRLPELEEALKLVVALQRAIKAAEETDTQLAAILASTSDLPVQEQSSVITFSGNASAPLEVRISPINQTAPATKSIVEPPIVDTPDRPGVSKPNPPPPISDPPPIPPPLEPPHRGVMSRLRTFVVDCWTKVRLRAP